MSPRVLRSINGPLHVGPTLCLLGLPVGVRTHQNQTNIFALPEWTYQLVELL